MKQPCLRPQVFIQGDIQPLITALCGLCPTTDFRSALIQLIAQGTRQLQPLDAVPQPLQPVQPRNNPPRGTVVQIIQRNVPKHGRLRRRIRRSREITAHPSPTGGGLPSFFLARSNNTAADAVDHRPPSRLDFLPASVPPLAKQIQPARGCLDDRRETDAGKGPGGLRPDEAASVERLDEVAQEQRVAVAGGTRGAGGA